MSPLLAVVLILTQAPDPLVEAQRAFDELQFERVLSLTPAPAAWKGLTREQAVRALSLRGLALASSKRDAEATVAFRQLLSLEPAWQLPEQFGPRVRTLVLEAKDAAERAGRLSISVEAGAVVVTGGDAFGLAEQVSLSWKGPEGVRTVTKPLAPKLDAPWASPTGVTAWLSVLGPGATVLATWGTQESPKVLAPSAPSVTEAKQGKPLSRLSLIGIVVGAAGLAAVGAGVYALTLADRPQQALLGATRDSTGRITSLTQREAFALDANANTAWQVAGGLLIGGALAVAGGVTLFVLGLQVSASPGSVALTVPLDATFAPLGVAR